MIRTFRITGALILWSALIVQFILFQTDPDKKSAFSATVGYFSYFTILANLVGATVMAAVAFEEESCFANAAASPQSRTAAVLYIVIVGIVYHALLAPLWNPQGWQLATDIVLHTIAPLMLTAEWLFFTPKRGLRLASVAGWLGLPLAYGAYSLTRGAATGIYPYFFLNVAELGYPQVLLNLVGLLAVFAGAGSALVALGRKLPDPPFRNLNLQA